MQKKGKIKLKNIIWTNRSNGLETLIMIIAGAILVFMPGLTADLITKGLAVISLFYGFMNVFRYLDNRKDNNAYTIDIIIGIISLLFGIFVWTNPHFILSFLPMVLGILLIINGLAALPLFFQFGLIYIPAFFTSIIPLVLGIILIINPYGIAKSAIQIFGIVILISGISNLITLLKSSK